MLSEAELLFLEKFDEKIVPLNHSENVFIIYILNHSEYIFIIFITIYIYNYSIIF